MRECRTYGFVRGAPSNGRPYRDQAYKDRIVARLLPPESAAVEAVIATAAMDEAARSAWCRERGVYAADLEAWKQDAIAGLGELNRPGFAGGSNS